MIALIMVLSMVPGILAGVESSRIDYDAVAYRTSVILCEDPGSPASDDVQISVSGKKPWERYDLLHKSEIERLGLAVSSLTPNILSKNKVENFFNMGDELTFDEEDYRSLVIFGDYPYNYNISLKIGGDTYMNGSPVPDSGYGYMRRLVKMKEPGYALIDSADYNETFKSVTALDPSVDTVFSVPLDYYGLQNNRTIGEEYRFRPESEPVSVTLYNFRNSLNRSDVTSVELTDVLLRNSNGDEIPVLSGDYDDNIYRLYIDGTQYRINGLPPDIKDSEEIRMELMPDLYSELAGAGQLKFTLDFDMTYTFEPDESMNHYFISTEDKEAPFDYDHSYMTRPYLREGAMEVLIW